MSFSTYNSFTSNIMRSTIKSTIRSFNSKATNLISDANGVYGVELLNSGYTGAIFNIRRSSDSSVADFYDTNSMLQNSSGTSLTNWLSGATAYVIIWYDQSSTGNNATQTNTNLQPVYDLTNLYVNFKGNRYFILPDSTVPVGNTNYTVTIKHDNNINTDSGGWLGGGLPKSNDMLAFRTYTGAYFSYWYDTNNSFRGGTVANNNIVTFSYDGTNQYQYVNKILQKQAAISNRNTTGSNNNIGVTNGSEYLNGALRYMYIYPRNLSSNERLLIEK